MRTLVTGAWGMLARAAIPLLDAKDTLLTDKADLDIADARAVAAQVVDFKPERILHLAAYTAVDAAETDPEGAREVNAVGTENVARSAAEARAQLVLMSTDYVFDGSPRRPLREDDPTGPASVYGKTKLEGEGLARAACPKTLVVRTSWLFGEGGPNFIDTIAGRLRRGEPVAVVDDQVGRPTWTNDLAPAVLALADRAESGVYHLTNGGEPVSWYEVARHVAVCVDADPALVSATTTDELARPAPRPAYSVLDCSKAEKLGVGPLPDWREAVARHLGVKA